MNEKEDLGSAAVAAPRPSTAESIAWARDVLKPPTMKRPTVAELEALLSDTKPPPIQIKADGSIEIAHFPEVQHIANLLEEIERWPQLGVIEVMIRNPAVDEWVRENEAEIARLRERLEMTHAWQFIDGQKTRIDVEPGSIPDGIECRDETIRLQDREIKRLRALVPEQARLEEVEEQDKP